MQGGCPGFGGRRSGGEAARSRRPRLTVAGARTVSYEGDRLQWSMVELTSASSWSANPVERLGGPLGAAQGDGALDRRDDEGGEPNRLLRLRSLLSQGFSQELLPVVEARGDVISLPAAHEGTCEVYRLSRKCTVVTSG